MTAKKSTPKKKAAGTASPKLTGSSPESTYQPPPNDFLSAAFEQHNLIPADKRGTDQFLDLVTWNIRYFHDQDARRVARIVDVLSGLNADVIVLQEIRNLSMDIVAAELRAAGVGHYVAAYGTTGGDQRIAMLYDLDWVRSKDDIRELFGRGEVLASDGKDAFPRLPFWGYFTGLTETDPFDFQVVGVHLKSQRGGGAPQRERSAEVLSEWLTNEAVHSDSDVIIVGDWNEPPNASTWAPIHKLEAEKLVKFKAVNNSSEISHLMFKNKNNLGSRLDLNAISMAASKLMKKPPEVVRWVGLDDFLEGNPRAADIRAYLSGISRELSDHLPVVTRFYFERP